MAKPKTYTIESWTAATAVGRNDRDDSTIAEFGGHRIEHAVGLRLARQIGADRRAEGRKGLIYTTGDSSRARKLPA